MLHKLAALISFSTVLFPALSRQGCAPAGGSAVAAERLVMLVPRSAPRVSRSLREALLAQLSDTGIRLRVAPAVGQIAGPGCQSHPARAWARKRGVAAVVWFDSQGGRVCLLLSPRRGGRLVQRAVGGAGAEGRFEAAAVVVRAALLESSRRPRQLLSRASKRASGPRSKGSPPVTRSALSSRLELGLAYSLDVVSPEAAAHGLRLALHLRLAQSWTLELGYRLEARIQVGSAEDGAELQRYPLDLGAGYRLRLGLVEVGGRVGLGFAYSRLVQRLPATSANAVRSSSRWLLFIDCLALVGIRPRRRLLLWLALGARIYAVNARYSINGGSALLEPWPVQPTALAGLTVDLL